MKKIAFAIIVCFFITVCYIVYAQVGKSYGSENETMEKIQNLSERYEDRFYYAVFSLNEFRSYSIIKVDKLIDNYNNEWNAPEDIVANLNLVEKDSVMQNTVEMIENVYKNRKKDMIDKIRYWCMADIQFDFLENRFDFNRHTIIQAIIETNYDFNFKDEIIRKTPENSGFEQEIDEARTYHATLNLLSGLNFDNQLKYYSKIYYQLATID